MTLVCNLEIYSFLFISKIHYNSDYQHINVFEKLKNLSSFLKFTKKRYLCPRNEKRDRKTKNIWYY